MMVTQDIKPRFIPIDELIVRERMRSDLDESGIFSMTEIYARMAPKLSMSTLRRIKQELLDDYLAMRHQRFQV